MKTKFIAIGIVFLIFLLQSCTSKKYETTEISNYRKWEKNTTKILSEKFINVLPETDTVSKYGKSYYYKPSQSALGDYNFVICVELQFKDKGIYESELGKYTEVFLNSDSNNNISYYYMQDFLNDREEYIDEKIYDGMFYDFEIVSANQSEYTICLIYAHVWDYYKDQVLIDYLNNINI